jgi:hypothetical protein
VITKKKVSRAYAGNRGTALESLSLSHWFMAFIMFGYLNDTCTVTFGKYFVFFFGSKNRDCSPKNISKCDRE